MATFTRRKRRAQVVRLTEADAGTGTTAFTLALEDQAGAVRDAIWDRNRLELLDEQRWLLINVYLEFAVVRCGVRWFKVPYTIGADGVIAFGTPEQVSIEFVPVKLQESFTAKAVRMVESDGGAAELQGLRWEVEIIVPGWSENGVHYSREALREAVKKFEGAHVYVLDTTDGHAPAEQKTQDRMGGWIDGVQQQETGVLTGTLHFLQEGVAAPMRRKLVDAWNRGKRDLFGLSVDVLGRTRQGTQGGRKGRLCEAIVAVNSVDVVLRPAAGGKFTRLVASRAPAGTTQEGGLMKLKERLVRFLEARRPAALSGIDRDDVEALDEALNEAERAEFYAEPKPASAAPESQAGAGQPSAAEKAETRILVRERLTESKLPDAVQARIRKDLDGQVLTESQIDDAIKAERAYLAALNPARPSGGGPSNGNTADVHVGAGRVEKLQAACDKYFELDVDGALKEVKPLRGFRELYNEVTLGHDTDVSGVLHESARTEMLREAFTTTTLPEIVANSMNRRMARDFAAVSYGEERIISARPAVTDFRQRSVVRVGYFPDLASVDLSNPATNYPEIATFSDDVSTYTPGTKGNQVTITRPMIKNDDLGFYVKLSSRFGRSAKRTLARDVWSFVISNRVLTIDGKALFHTDHGNLGVGAPTVANLTAAKAAMFRQKEPDSNEVLGLKPVCLCVPEELWATATQINQSMIVPGGSFGDANPFYHYFGEKNENIHVLPFATDTNNWYLFGDPNELEMVEVGFMDGNETPQILVADLPAVGAMFDGDRIRMRLRYEYGCEMLSWEGCYGALVP